MDTKDVKKEPRGLRVAIEGCGHGELDKIYETMQRLEQLDGRKFDLLICCGDFQAVRNLDDLECMACPPKYRSLGTFYKYYSGEKQAAYPTLFIGGNHEASNYLWELYHGGWVAPNIFFMGYAGVVNFGGVRIGGISGIYKQQHYTMGHFERPPYNESTMRSAYHIRSIDVYRLLRLRHPIDVFLSHDWPAGIARHGDTAALFRKKRFLQREIEDGSLGSPPAAEILESLKPKYWFSAHLHTKFAALVRHADGKETRFLSLDKCLPGRQFLQLVDFPDAEGPLEFSYDEEWLTVLRATHSLTSLHFRPMPPPPPEPITATQQKEVREMLVAAGIGLRIPNNFQQTAPPYVDPGPGTRQQHRGCIPQESLRNPQTVALLTLLGLDYNLDPSTRSDTTPATDNPEEIDLDDDEDRPTGEGNAVDPAIAAVCL